MDTPRSPLRPSKAPALLLRLPQLWAVPLIVALSALAGGALTTGPILCPFRRFTGLPCATCGMTRAFVALTQGELAAAVALHALSPLVFAAMIVWWARTALAVVRGVRPPALSGRWLLAFAALLLGWWLVRVVAQQLA